MGLSLIILVSCSLFAAKIIYTNDYKSLAFKSIPHNTEQNLQGYVVSIDEYNDGNVQVFLPNNPKLSHLPAKATPVDHFITIHPTLTQYLYIAKLYTTQPIKDFQNTTIYIKVHLIYDNSIKQYIINYIIYEGTIYSLSTSFLLILASIFAVIIFSFLQYRLKYLSNERENQ